MLYNMLYNMLYYLLTFLAGSFCGALVLAFFVGANKNRRNYHD